MWLLLIYNKIMGNMVASEDFNMKTGERYNPQTGEYEDTFRTVKAGEKVDVSKNPDMKQYSEFLKTESGTSAKVISSAFDSSGKILSKAENKLENLLNPSSVFSESSTETPNSASDSSNNNKNSQNANSGNNNFHDKSPMSNISEIISQNAYSTYL